jgi:hypothetical protein
VVAGPAAAAAAAAAAASQYLDGLLWFVSTVSTELPGSIGYMPLSQITRIAGMTADSDRHLARFERVSPLTLSMGIAADLGIALVISKSSSSKATDEQVERTGHMTILSGGLDWIHRFYNQRARQLAVHLDMAHLPSTCGLSQASSSK